MALTVEVSVKSTVDKETHLGRGARLVLLTPEVPVRLRPPRTSEHHPLRGQASSCSVSRRGSSTDMNSQSKITPHQEVGHWEQGPAGMITIKLRPTKTLDFVIMMYRI